LIHFSSGQSLIQEEATMAESPNEPNLPMKTRARAIELNDRTRASLRRNSGAAGPVLPEVLTAPPSPADLVKGLKRRWPLALGLSVLVVPLAAALAFFLIPAKEYTARALLRVFQTPPKMVFETSEGSYNLTEFKTYKETQTSLIRSPLVIQAALRDPGVAASPSLAKEIDPVQWLQKAINVRFDGEIMEISISTADPNEAKTLVQAIRDAYMKEVVYLEKQKRMERFNNLKDINDKQASALRTKKDKLRQLADAAGSNDKETIALMQQLRQSMLMDTQRELSELQSELNKTRIVYESLMSRDDAHLASQIAITPQELNDALMEDRQYAQLTARSTELRKTIKQHSDKVRNERDPAIRQLVTELNTNQAAMRDRLEEIKTALLASKQMQTGGQSPLELIRDKIAILEEQERQITLQKQQLIEGNTALNRKSLDMEQLTESIVQEEKTVQQIGEQLAKLKVELDAPERIIDLKDVYVPKVADSKKQLIASVGAAVGSLAAILFCVSFLEVRRKRVDRVEQIVQGLGMDLVGVLPAMPVRRRAIGSDQGREQEQWDHILLESVDATCAILLHASRAEALQAIMVVSAVTGEGKTSLACHLATSLARAKRRTLLVDCDLRNPAAHLMYGLPLEGGMCEILRGEIDVTEAIQPTMASGLSMITAGLCDPIAIQSLAHGGVKPVLDRLRADFDFIIVDSAPVLPVADSLHISQQVDAVLFSVLRDVSRLPKIYAAYERLSRLGVRIMGAVVSGTPCEDYRSSYVYRGGNPRLHGPAASPSS
jgi:capsular exopolysaccharide synthesis family protein